MDGEVLVGGQAGRRRAAGALRALAPVVAFGEVPTADLDRLADSLEDLVRHLAEHQPASRHEHTGGVTTLRGDQPHVWEGHPIGGASSSIAAPLLVEEVDEHIQARGAFGVAYEGAPGTVQGGFLAAAFDFVLGRQAALTGLLVVTGTLTVRFRAPLPVCAEVVLTGELGAVDGRKVVVLGTATCGGTVVADADATFISVGADRYAYEPPA